MLLTTTCLRLYSYFKINPPQPNNYLINLSLVIHLHSDSR